MTDPIRAALERLIVRLHETDDPNGPVPAWSDSYLAALAALAQPEQAGDVSDEEIRDLADFDHNFDRYDTTNEQGEEGVYWECWDADLIAFARAAIAIALSRAPQPVQGADALAARPLLEQVARMGDRIGQHTVGEVMAISNRAAAWLRDNPPGRPVAIEPRGCPTPGACSCVEPQPVPPADGELGP